MVGHNRVSFSCNIVTLSIGLELFLLQRRVGTQTGAGRGGDGGPKKKDRAFEALSFFSSASHDAVVLVGKSSQFFSWKPARKDARTSEKP